MRKYEIVLIFDTALEEEKRNQIMERLNGIIEADGKIEETTVWGVKKLAYLIDDKPEGYYVIIACEGTPEMVKEYDRVVKILDGILRHMITRIEE